MRFIERLLREALYDVCFANDEGLDDSAEGEELEWCWGGHCDGYFDLNNDNGTEKIET